MKLVFLKSKTPTTNLSFYRLFSPLIYSNYANISHNMSWFLHNISYNKEIMAK
jgi:hypothetical protein